MSSDVQQVIAQVHPVPSKKESLVLLNAEVEALKQINAHLRLKISHQRIALRHLNRIYNVYLAGVKRGYKKELEEKVAKRDGQFVGSLKEASS